MGGLKVRNTRKNPVGQFQQTFTNKESTRTLQLQNL